jgi:hypothetical protein
MATVNLVEWLALDQRVMVRHVLPAVGLKSAVAGALAVCEAEQKPSAMLLLKAIGRHLAGEIELKASPRSPFGKLLRHPSDVVRSWACFAVTYTDGLTLTRRIEALQPLAADPHFGVRETAWMALRPAVEGELEPAIELLCLGASPRPTSATAPGSNAALRRLVFAPHPPQSGAVARSADPGAAQERRLEIRPRQRRQLAQ